MEQEATTVRGRLERLEALRETSFAMPSRGWIQRQLSDLLPVLREDAANSARLLRRLLGRVTAETVIPRGKKRGYIRLHVRVTAGQILGEVLGKRLATSAVEPVAPSPVEEPIDLFLDLGEPSRYDRLAPEIAEMRTRGVTWKEIARATGLSLGNAYNIWKRWTYAQPRDRPESA
jgi:hypothetical protein